MLLADEGPSSAEAADVFTTLLIDIKAAVCQGNSSALSVVLFRKLCQATHGSMEAAWQTFQATAESETVTEEQFVSSLAGVGFPHPQVLGED